MYQLNPALRDFWRTRKPYKLLKGGRFSSKTQDAGGMAAFLARNYTLKFLCIRQFQNRITDSVYTVIKQKIIEAGWEDEFDIGVSSIKHKKTKSEFLFYGIARNLNDIKGTEGVDICWIEEGEALTEEQWGIIDPTIRKDGSEIWLLWNPFLQTDFVQAKLPMLLGDDCIIRHINYDENPFLSETARQKAERMKLVDPDAYKHIFLGIPLSSDELSIIKGHWIDAALDAHLHIPDFPKGGGRIAGFDLSGGVEGDVIAPKSNDPNALAWRHGCILMGLEEWQDENPNKAAAHAYPILARENIDATNIDDIGVGASVPGELRRLQKEALPEIHVGHTIRFNGWTASEAPHNPEGKYQPGKTNGDMFLNKKAQGWGLLADRFRNTWQARNGLPYDPQKLISIPSGLPLREKLAAELSQPRRESMNGKMKVESKSSLKKRGIPSHNCFVAGTMIETPRGPIAIENLRVGDEVVTPKGVTRIVYTHARKAHVVSRLGLTGTPDHKVFCWGKGWIPLQTLTSCSNVDLYRNWGSTWNVLNALFSRGTHSSFSKKVDTMCAEGRGKALTLRDFYIDAYGTMPMARYLLTMTCIMLMAIRGTMTFRIWNVSRLMIIVGSICSNVSSALNIAKETGRNFLKRKKVQGNGTEASRVRNGIENTGGECSDLCQSMNMNAHGARKSIVQRALEALDAARESAQQQLRTKKQKRLMKANASHADVGSSTQCHGAQVNTGSVDCASQERTVYNITLLEHNAYYANGILVRNCADAVVMAFWETSTGMTISKDALRESAMPARRGFGYR